MITLWKCRRLAWLAGFALCAVGCGGGGGASTPPNAQPRVATVENQVVTVGDTKTITVVVSDGNSADTHTIRATSSDSQVVTVSLAGNVLTITAVAPGSATVTISATDSSGAANATSSPTTFTVMVESRGWTAGVFEDAAGFKDLCATPRTGEDAAGASFPDRQGTAVDENNWLRSWSNDTYLWYDEIEDRDPACCATPDYFNLLRTFARTESGAYKDRFHFTEDTAARLARVTSGVVAGYGARFAVLRPQVPRDVRVAYTQPDSPATAEDVALRRGTRIIEVDGVSVRDGNANVLNAGLFPGALGERHVFTVRDPGAAAARAVTMTSAAIVTAPVQHARVIETATGAVGYLLFNSHIGPAERGLMGAIDTLSRRGVVDLVVDLRYNGGGYLAIAAQLAYMIAGPASQGRVFNELQFNAKHTVFNPITDERLRPSYFRPTTTGWWDEPANRPLPYLGLRRVFVLTGRGTCSASEAIINGLRGIDVEVVQIGAATCGKPYGFYPRDNCGTTYNTVQFRGVNAKGFGDFADGFVPSNAAASGSSRLPGCAVADDFEHPFGDPNEARLAAALRYRGDGSCPPVTAQAMPPVAKRVGGAVFDPSPAARGEAIAAEPRWRSR